MCDKYENILDPLTGLYIHENCHIDYHTDCDESENIFNHLTGLYVHQDCDESENILDPLTGLYVHQDCDENSNSNSNEECIDNSDLHNNNNNNVCEISVSVNDLFSSNINLAILSNYEDNKNESKFASIILPELKIDYLSLTKIFFYDFGKSFSVHILDKIWCGLKNFSLINTVLEKYTELNDINRNEIQPIKMIQLHKECSIKKITKIANKVVALNLSEFNNALGSLDVREDRNICANIIINLFFNSLNIGVKLTLRFVISNIPHKLIGKISDDNMVEFKLDSHDLVDNTMSIIFINDC